MLQPREHRPVDDRHPDLRRDATRREVLWAGEGDDAREGEGSEGVVAAGGGTFARIAAALVGAVNHPGDLRLHDAAHQPAHQADPADGPTRSLLAGEPRTDPVTRITVELLSDAGGGFF